MRGAFFTLSALVVCGFAVSAFLLLISTSTNYNEGIQTRIFTLSGFLEDAQKDLERASQIATTRAILAISDKLILQGSYVDNFTLSFEEAIINGTFEGEELAVMRNTTLSTWVERVNVVSQRSRIGINFSVHSISVGQNTPWSIETNISANISVWDETGLASFIVEHNSIAHTPIIGFEDPLYIVKSAGKVTNIINQSQNTNFVSGTDVSILLNHTYQGFYIASSDAPSFLDRFEGKLSANPQGIESLVDLSKFALQGVPTLDRSIVDHSYFGNGSEIEYHINGTPSWFKIDPDHLSTYEVNDLIE